MKQARPCNTADVWRKCKTLELCAVCAAFVLLTACGMDEDRTNLSSTYGNRDVKLVEPEITTEGPGAEDGNFAIKRAQSSPASDARSLRKVMVIGSISRNERDHLLTNGYVLYQHETPAKPDLSDMDAVFIGANAGKVVLDPEFRKQLEGLPVMTNQ